MKALLLAVATAFAFQARAKAQILTLTPSAQSIDGVTIAKSATVTVDNQSQALTTVAAGLRKHWIAFFSLNVYVGQLLVNDPSVLVKTDSGILPSTDQVRLGAIMMTFVRSVSVGQMVTAYRDGLDKNYHSTIDQVLKEPAVVDFFNKVKEGGDVESGQTVTLLLAREPNGQEVLTYDNGKGYVKPVVGGAGFLHTIYAIWLGAGGKGVTDLKSQWLKWKPAP